MLRLAATISASVWLRCLIAPASAQTSPQPPTVILPVPDTAGSLTFASPPFAPDTGVFGKWYIDGVLSGLGIVQSNAGPSDRTTLADISNGQVFIEKIDGMVQFHIQAGAYAIPQLGTPYGHLSDTSNALGNYFGVIPQAFLRLQLTDDLAVSGGKLPTLIGPEDTFDFENYNIERGLLWVQEPAISRGVQASYKIGSVKFRLSFNDGYYSNRFNWVSGSATWAIDPTNTLVFSAASNLGKTDLATVATPLAQNNSAIYNVIYTFSKAPLTITPYLQYSHVDPHAAIGIYSSASTYSGAVLGDYVFTPKFQLAGRAEYIRSEGGKSALVPTNLLYGTGSGAISFTVTPTFTFDRFFVRADLSVVEIIDLVAGDGFGHSGRADTQVRGMLESGVIF